MTISCAEAAGADAGFRGIGSDSCFVDAAPLGEDSSAPAPQGSVESEEGEEDSGTIGQWVTFLNSCTGKTLTLPAHNEAETPGRWCSPGAWTSDDDVLDDQALTIISGINMFPSLTPAPPVPANHHQQAFSGSRVQASPARGFARRHPQPLLPGYEYSQEDLLPAFLPETPLPFRSLPRLSSRVSSDFLQSPRQTFLARARRRLAQMSVASVLGVWVFIWLGACLAYFWGAGMPYIIERRDTVPLTAMEPVLQDYYEWNVESQASR